MSTAEVSSESSHDSVKQSPIPRPAPRPPPIPPQLAHELPQGRVNVEDYRLPLLPEDIVGQLDDLTKDHHRSVPRWQRFLTSVLDSWHIHRFCDIRQVKWQEMIEPSGSNIAHLEDLYLTYLWYWDWLEWIHCDSIIGVSDADIASLKANNRSDYNRPSLVLVRYEELKVLLARIKELARTNLAKAFPNPRIPDGYLVHHPEYEWVYTWRKEMHKTLIAMAEHYPAHGYPDMGDLDRVDEVSGRLKPRSGSDAPNYHPSR